MSRNVEWDVIQAETAGKVAKKAFFQDRLTDFEKMFFEPIKSQKFITMESSNKTVKFISSQERV